MRAVRRRGLLSGMAAAIAAGSALAQPRVRVRLSPALLARADLVVE